MKATMAIYSVQVWQRKSFDGNKNKFATRSGFNPFPFFDFLVFVVVVCTSSSVSFITMQIHAWYVAIFFFVSSITTQQFNKYTTDQ